MSLKYLRTALVAAGVTMFAASGAHATVVATGPNPLPNGTGFDLHTSTGICVLGATECTHDIFISNLQMVNSSSITNGYDDQLTATFVAAFDNGATATLSLVPGTFFDDQITGGYNPFTNFIGTFPETLVSASFAGSDSNGNAITASLLGNTDPTTGSVTITNPSSGVYDIDNSFTVNAGSTVNGTPIAVPPLGATNTANAVPAVAEPASLALLGVALAGLAVIVRRRSGGASSQHVICNA